MNKLFVTTSLVVFLAFGATQIANAQSFDDNENDDNYILDEDFLLRDAIEAINDKDPGLGDYMGETMDSDELLETADDMALDDWLEGL